MVTGVWEKHKKAQGQPLDERETVVEIDDMTWLPWAVKEQIVGAGVVNSFVAVEATTVGVVEAPAQYRTASSRD